MHFKSYGIKGEKGLIRHLPEERPRMLRKVFFVEEWAINQKELKEEEDRLRNVGGRYLTEEISDKKKQMEETGRGRRRRIEGKKNTFPMSLRPRLSSTK